MTLTPREILEELQTIAAALKPSQIRVLAEMAESLQKKIHSESLPGSTIVTPEFLDSFADRLLIHHAMGAEKLNKKPFEFAFVQAIRASGQHAELAVSATNPGADVKIGDKRYSLKTEAARTISKTSITVSKLAEARWIREAGKSQTELYNGIQTEILPRFEAYDCVLILRGSDDNLGELPAVRYDLVEIPLKLLKRLALIKPEDIKVALGKNGEPGKNGGGSVRVLGAVEQDKRGKNKQPKHLFTLGFDGSVEKLRIGSLKISECIVHATWIIPIPPEVALIPDERHDEEANEADGISEEKFV